MSAPVNLNKLRKERDRAARKARADENAVQFGQSKAHKETLKQRAEQSSRLHDGHKRET
jgi:hypothetical protein